MIRVRVKSYNRPETLANVLGDVARDQRPDLELTVFDDASTAVMDEPRAICAAHGWSWRTADANHGKAQAWRWHNAIYESLRDIGPDDLAIFLEDDVRLCDDFFERVLSAWASIADPRKVSLHLHVDDSRHDKPCWTGQPPQPMGLVRKTQWIDGPVAVHRRMLEAIDWRLDSISPRRWARDPRRSTGVGQQLSRRLHAGGFGMYQTAGSLVVHLGGPSLYNPEERRRTPLRTVDFVDGEPARRRLLRTAPVMATIATVPSRTATLERVLRVLMPQVDALGLYLNGFKGVPSFLIHPRITLATSRVYGDRGDAGKFFWAAGARGYRFTCDDDILYPTNYVDRMVAAIERHRRRAIIGVHGAVLHRDVTSYYRDRTCAHFSHALAADTPQHVLGTGTVAYHSDTIDLDSEMFPRPNMADIWLGLAAQRQRVPMIAVTRPDGWLRPLPTEGSIYDDLCDRDADVTAVLKEIWPWTLHATKKGSVRKLVKGMRKA